MTQENVEIVRALIALWNTGDRGVLAGALADYCDPAIELEGPLSSVSGEPYRGYAGIELWVRDLDEQFLEWRISIDEMHHKGDQVIAVVTVDATGRASDVVLHFASATVARFGSDHRVTRVRIYSDVNEALKAVGLEE
jgi:ketosteroid isomerase-like protein